MEVMLEETGAPIETEAGAWLEDEVDTPPVAPTGVHIVNAA
jgi:hypothetical protein